MMNILELLEKYTREKPSAPILFDDAHSSGVSYARLDDVSGRVYAWLKKAGIGKEDFVLINLPRGVLPVCAMIGIWKAGAAWVLVEDTYAPERIRFISKDCGCKIELDMAAWEEAMHEDPLSGREPMDDHDAAYAVYTSGTTGNPKGVLHEFGNLQMAIDSINVDGKVPFGTGDRVAVLAPMNFVATIIVILKCMEVFCGRNYIVSYATIKNPSALKRFFLEKRISVTFLTPSYVRMLGTHTGPFLRVLFVGSEPANNLYNKKLQLINIYAASESGFAVSVFNIDRSYEACPVGRPSTDINIYLLDEDGNEVADGEVGELCFDDPYVRGYINLPEETEKAFKNRVFHSGDLGRKEADGNYVLLGRSGDMIKINGNRIEPAEIEAAVKEALHIDWVAARGFESKGKSFLCAYYTADVSFDQNELREELMKRLPYYMIPAFFMKIDSVPLKASGKLDRKALPEPDTKDFVGEYEAPENEIEEKLCDIMAKVLDVERIGRKDDFYELGGDSLSSMQVIADCDLPGLNASEIFRGRTPERIAQLYIEKHENDDGESPEMKEFEARKTEHPLTAEQLYMVDYQLYTPKSTMYNLFSMLKLDKDSFDMERIAVAVKTAVANHPALLTKYHFNEDGEIVQKYCPEVLRDIHVEHISEFEFDSVKDTLVQPFKIIGGTMYRCRIYETEKNGYVFFDVHHSLFDGTSLKVLMGDIGKAYMGMPLDTDYYYSMLSEREAVEHTPFYEESREYFVKRYEDKEYSSYPDPDHESRDNTLGELITELGIEQPQMAAIERAYRISRNEFFITAAGIAIALYNKKNDIRLAWIYNGREDLQMMDTVGLLFRELPVSFSFTDSSTLRNIFADVHEQVQKAIEHSCYPYVDKTDQVSTKEEAYLLYQRDIRDMGGADGMDLEMIDIRQNQAASQTILDMEILDGADGLQLMIDYTSGRYTDESMQRFMELYVKTAQMLVTHNSQADITFREIRDKLENKKNFFSIFAGIFSKKK